MSTQSPSNYKQLVLEYSINRCFFC